MPTRFYMKTNPLQYIYKKKCSYISELYTFLCIRTCQLYRSLLLQNKWLLFQMITMSKYLLEKAYWTHTMKSTGVSNKMNDR